MSLRFAFSSSKCSRTYRAVLRAFPLIFFFVGVSTACVKLLSSISFSKTWFTDFGNWGTPFLLSYGVSTANSLNFHSPSSLMLLFHTFDDSIFAERQGTQKAFIILLNKKWKPRCSSSSSTEHCSSSTQTHQQSSHCCNYHRQGLLLASLFIQL